MDMNSCAEGVSREEFEHIIYSNRIHFKNLENIIRKSGEELEGNCVYSHLTLQPLPELIPKQMNLYNAAIDNDKILEIGFNAGHSALFFLLANPNARIWCFDICDHLYTRPCFQYLNEAFGNRLYLYYGNSVFTLGKFVSSNPEMRFDLFHIDGSHNMQIANLDFFSCRTVARNNSLLIWDDVQIPELYTLYNGYILNKLISPVNEGVHPTSVYTHAIARFTIPVYKIAVCSLTLGETYKQITRYGRRTKVDYCSYHKYDFYDDEDCVDMDRPLAWSKIKIILKYIEAYDYVVWIDGDTYIMNPLTRLENIISEYTSGRDITVAQDWKMINTGVMVIKNTEWSRKFLNLVYDQVQFINDTHWEQSAFIYLYDHNISDSKNHINVLPLSLQNKLNSYWFSYYYDDCFILHFPGCSTNIEGALQAQMNRFCPIKRDEETSAEFYLRKYWLKYKSRNDIDNQLQNE